MSSEAPDLSLSRDDILLLVRGDLIRVESALRKRTGSALPIINAINQYLHESGGKRLRPAVLLLCSKLFGYEGEGAIKLGEVVELIHVATLVHDDIIDNADFRRGRPSVKARWGNQVTVLAGDWLYMTAFQVALELRNLQVLDILIDITRGMVEGELLQLENNADLSTSAEEHLHICARKTARLFSGCGRLAGIVAKQDEETQEKLAAYGRSLGIAFQLTDDLLDFTGSAGVLGKPVLKDLEEGKVTLPIIYLWERASGDEKAFLTDLVESGDFSPEKKKYVLQLTDGYGTLEKVRQLARRYADQAVNALDGLPANVYRDALQSLPYFVINRKQ